MYVGGGVGSADVGGLDRSKLCTLGVLCEDMDGTMGVGVCVRGEAFVVAVVVQREFGFMLVGRRSDGDDDTGNVAGLSDGEGGTYVVDGNDGVEYKICISVSSSTNGSTSSHAGTVRSKSRSKSKLPSSSSSSSSS